MATVKSPSDLAKILKDYRRAANINRSDLALKLGISCEDIIRLECADDVGLHAFLSTLDALGLVLKVEEVLPENVKVVDNFDEYYQKRFQSNLKNKARLNPKGQGFLKPEDRKRISIKNLKKSFDI